MKSALKREDPWSIRFFRLIAFRNSTTQMFQTHLPLHMIIMKLSSAVFELQLLLQYEVVKKSRHKRIFPAIFKS